MTPFYPFEIYRSSAGSGKTYTLAINFIALALSKSNAFRHILAVTFTNKATKEMKERIVSFLRSLANDEDNAPWELLEQKTGLNRQELSNRASSTLTSMLHNYTEFYVQTIDSFFQRIVKSFARELGMFGNFTIELNEALILEIVVDELIEEAGNDVALTKWLVQFARENVEDDKNWDIKKDILQLAGELLKEEFQAHATNLKILNSDKEEFQAQINTIKTLLRNHESKLKEFAKDGLKIMDSHGLSIEDFKYKKGGALNAFNNILIGKYDFGSRARNAIEDRESLLNRKGNVEAQEQALESGVYEDFVNAVHYADQHRKDINTSKEFLRNANTLGLFTNILKKLEDYRKENSVMLISDTGRFLSEFMRDNHSDFIYEKTGSWFRNFMLDEFQDTSLNQWSNFLPLIDDSLANNNYSLAVGDAKQSIYRWRNGDWKLIAGKVEEDLRADQINYNELKTNWRSDYQVVAFNNSLYRQLPWQLKQHFLTISGSEDPEIITMASDFDVLYRNADQLVSPYKDQKKDEGYVKIQFLDADEWKEKALDQTIKVIEDVQTNGYEAADIAILVRTNNEGANVVRRLVEYKNSGQAKEHVVYDVVSNEALFVDANFAVQIVLYALRFIDDPSDYIARTNLAYSSGKNIENFIGTINSFSPAMQGEGDHFTAQEKELLDNSFLPIPDLAEMIIRMFGLGEDSENVAYLSAFQDAILEFEQREGGGIKRFLEWWDQSGQKKTLQMPDEMNAIKVLTVHKSKGLEYPVVIIPFADWMFDHDSKRSNYIWSSIAQFPFDQLGAIPLRYSKRLNETHFRNAYLEEMHKAYIDNLNVLYVATTRAENGLYMFCPYPIDHKGKMKYHVSGFLYQAITNPTEELGGPENVPSEPLHQHFDAETRIFEIGQLTDKQKKYNDKSSDEIKYISNSWHDRIQIRDRSREFFLQTEKGQKINYGILVHDILSQINTEHDIKKQIELAFVDGELDDYDRQQIFGQLNAIMKIPQVKSWFDGSWDLKQEIDIIQPGKHPRRPDRVMIKNDNAVIVDFKTGKIEEYHKNQIKQYIQILREMRYQKIDGFLLYTTEYKVVEV